MKTQPKKAPLKKHFTHVDNRKEGKRQSEVIDEDYLNWVRKQKCCVSGCNNISVPHHIFSRKLGRRDDLVINVCQVHHVTGGVKEAIHQMGKVSWSEHFGIGLEEHAKALYAKYKSEQNYA